MADVCRATGISRTTLDRYYYDRVKCFDRDVLTRLCQYLKVKPGELLVMVEQPADARDHERKRTC